jgi:hypothetical protein
MIGKDMIHSTGKNKIHHTIVNNVSYKEMH